MLNEEQRRIGRRDFLKAAAALPAAGVFAFANRKTGAVKVACIGTGSEGGVLQEQMNLAPEFIKMVGVCDIYRPNRDKGLARARVHVPDAKDYGDDYKRVLNDSAVEGVVIATPLFAHAPIALDALRAGKHVFTEKTMAYTVDQCQQMVDLAKKNNRVLQVGHQRAYNPIYHQALQMVADGVIGDVYHVRALWHRNTDWRADARWEIDESFDPTPWGYEDFEHLMNWRLYRKHSRGLFTELLSHHLQVTNWLAGTSPQSVVSTGGLQRWKGNGREVEDHIYAIFEYPNDLTVTYSAIQSNRFDDYYEQIMGTKGTLILTHETEALLFREPGAAGGEPEESETSFEVTEEDAGPHLEASASRTADAVGAAVGGTRAGTPTMNPLTPYKIELEGFAHSIRTGEPGLCDGVVGREAAKAAIRAQESLDKGEKLALA